MLAVTTVNPARSKHFYLGFQAEHKLGAGALLVSGAGLPYAALCCLHTARSVRPLVTSLGHLSDCLHIEDSRLQSPLAVLPCCHPRDLPDIAGRWQPRAAVVSPAPALRCSGPVPHAAARACAERCEPRARPARRRRGGAGPERAQGGAHGGQGGRVRARHGVRQDPVLCRGAGVRPVQGAPTPSRPCVRSQRCRGAGAASSPARPPRPWRSGPPASNAPPAPTLQQGSRPHADRQGSGRRRCASWWCRRRTTGRSAHARCCRPRKPPPTRRSARAWWSRTRTSCALTVRARSLLAAVVAVSACCAWPGYRLCCARCDSNAMRPTLYDRDTWKVWETWKTGTQGVATFHDHAVR